MGRMRAVSQVFVALAAAFWVAAIAFDIARRLEPIRTLVLGGSTCLAIAAVFFFIDDHRRTRRLKPL